MNLLRVTIVTVLIFAVAFAAAVFCASPVRALDGTDDWDQQVDANGTIVLGDGSIVINGSDNPLPGQPWLNTSTQITTSSSSGEEVTFDWSYSTTDGAFFDKPQVLWNGEWYNLVEGNAQVGSGTTTGYIAAGGLFGFRVLSTDSCCGVGTLTITNTSWVVVTPPTPTEPPVEPTPSPSVAPTPTPEPSVEPTPTPEPTPEPTVEPTPQPTPEPTPQPTPEPTPNPTPEPTPKPTPEVTPEPTVEPTPEPTLQPTPQPSMEPSIEPTPDPSPTPESSPEGTVEPSVPPYPSDSPVPSNLPSPEPSQPIVQSPVEAVGEAVAAVGEAIGAVGEVLGDAVGVVTNLGNDLSPEEKQQAREAVLPAIIITQVAQAAVSMALSARPTSPSGGSSTTRSRKND